MGCTCQLPPYFHFMRKSTSGINLLHTSSLEFAVLSFKFINFCTCIGLTCVTCKLKMISSCQCYHNFFKYHFNADILCILEGICKLLGKVTTEINSLTVCWHVDRNNNMFMHIWVSFGVFYSCCSIQDKVASLKIIIGVSFAQISN